MKKDGMPQRKTQRFDLHVKQNRVNKIYKNKGTFHTNENKKEYLLNYAV